MQIHQKTEPQQPNSVWGQLTAAPHRIMFFSGALQLVIPVILWAIELIGRYTQLWSTLDTLVPTTWAHGFVMIYGVFIFFIYGFLMTTYPRWMNGPLVMREAYTSAAIWLNVGLWMFEIGIFFSTSLTFSGLGIFLFGWLLGQFSLFRVYQSAPTRDKTYETLLNFALLGGMSGVGSFLGWVMTDDWLYVIYALNAGIWLFLIPVLFTVSHRMIPFFSSNVIEDYSVFQPRWSLALMLTGCVIHLLLQLNYLIEWLFVVDLPMALVAWYHSYRWGLRRSLDNKLLAVLHIGFVWLGIGLALFSVQSLYLQFNAALILGKAPLHAITIGFVSSMLIAMASRVTLGHSGRALHLDTLSWWLFIGLQVTAILRVLADVNQLSSLAGLSLNVLAALTWVLVLGAWVIRFAPIYLRARIDGKPG